MIEVISLFTKNGKGPLVLLFCAVKQHGIMGLWDGKSGVPSYIV